MMNEKRFRKVMGFIQDNTCEKGDVDGLMDLADTEDMLNEQQDIVQSLQKDIVEMSDSYQSYLEMYSKTRSKMNDFIRTQRGKIFRLEKENEQLKSKNKKLQYINDQLEERLENSGIGIALKMDCDMMGEKRFSIFDDDEVEDVWNELKGTIYCHNEEEAQRCENWLNNLHNQNQKLKEENGRLQKNVENLQELVAELGATLLMNGFEIEINGKDLNELIKDE